MTGYILRRLLTLVPVLFIVSVFTFALLELVPGDAASIRLDDAATPEAKEQLRKDLGLDKSPVQRYLIWLSSAVQGDLGTSLRDDRPVSDKIKERLPRSALLAVGAMALTIMISIPAGVISSARPGSKLDRLGSYSTTFGIALPDFVIGVLLVFFFGVQLRLLPTSGWRDPFSSPWDGVQYLILPWLTLSGPGVAAVTRMVRSSMLETLSTDYVRTANAKGLRGLVVLIRHSLPNSLIASVTLLGLQFSRLLGGAVVVEVLFGIPGLGRLLVDSVTFKDTNAMMATVMIAAIAVVMVNTLVELVYGMLDPRARVS